MKKLLAVLLMLGLGVVNANAISICTPYQMKITFTGYTNRTSVLTNFPVLITLSNNISGSGFNYSNFISTNGYDLRFGVDSDFPATGLNYEIESWNTNGVSCVWVQVPTIPTNGSGAIWVNWGNSNATSQLPCTTNGTTWTNGYEGVWHLGNNGSTVLSTLDSTMRRAAGTTNRTPLASTGLVDGAVGYGTTVSNYVNLGVVPVNTNAGTVMLWWKPTTLTSEMPILTSRLGVVAGLFDVYCVASTLYCGWYKNNTDKRAIVPVSTAGIATNEWNNLCVTWTNGGNTILYVNGVLKGSSNLLTTTWDTSTTNMFLNFAVPSASGTNYFVDEVAISTFIRPTDWIWSAYQTAASNTTFSSYGVAAASGGTITNYTEGGTNFTAHIFTNSGILTFTSVGDVEYLVVGGGGAGGGSGAGDAYGSGGGGAGGYRVGSTTVLATTYGIVVGTGGVGTASSFNGNDGQTSVVFGIVAAGGGGGGKSSTSTGAAGNNGGSGGGGGGGSVLYAGGSGNTPAVTPSQGTNGGNGRANASTGSGGGGGGVSQVGAAATDTGNGGNGGTGSNCTFSGASTAYAGGGGGGAYSGTKGTGGSSVGGNGGDNTPTAPTSGTANRGGGGGGCAGHSRNQTSGSGGSGIVIVRYVSASSARPYTGIYRQNTIFRRNSVIKFY